MDARQPSVDVAHDAQMRITTLGMQMLAQALEQRHPVLEAWLGDLLACLPEHDGAALSRTVPMVTAGQPTSAPASL